MYRERVIGGSKADVVVGGAGVDRKRINDALDKHLERSSPSTSRPINGKDLSILSSKQLSILSSKQPPPHDHKDPLSKANASDGTTSIVTIIEELLVSFFF